MTLHVEPIASTARYFAPAKVYGDPYAAVATVTYCGDVAFVSALHGSIDRNFWRDMRTEFMARGIIDVLTVRHGKRIWIDVATGRVLSRGKRFPDDIK